MPVYTCTLWEYLTARDAETFGLEGRLELAVKLSKEVQLLKERSLIHRDLKPSNVIVDQGHTILLDFGIGTSDHVIDGSCGTAGFNAPENFACGKQWVQSDWFSLGKVLVLIIFEWRVGWQLIWNPRIWNETEDGTKFGRLDDIREMVANMLKVWAPLFDCLV